MESSDRSVRGGLGAGRHVGFDILVLLRGCLDAIGIAELTQLGRLDFALGDLLLGESLPVRLDALRLILGSGYESGDDVGNPAGDGSQRLTPRKFAYLPAPMFMNDSDEASTTSQMPRIMPIQNESMKPILVGFTTPCIKKMGPSP